jgi:hypothetical protein
MCHIYRRGELYGSAKEAAKICKMDRKRMFKSLATLQEKGMISKLTRQGQTSVYIASPVPQSEHLPVPKVEQVNAQPDPKTERHPFRKRNATRSTSGTPPVPKVEHKGSPIKDTPIKVLPLRIELPFDSPNFQQAWNDWEKYRKEKKCTLTESTIQRQIKDFKTWGESKSIEAINASIRNGWRGLFEPKQSTQAAQKQLAIHHDPFNERQHLIDTMP